MEELGSVVEESVWLVITSAAVSEVPADDPPPPEPPPHEIELRIIIIT